MNAVRIFYNILGNNVDKKSTWYNPKDNIIYIKLDNNFNYKYFLEADLYDNISGRQLFIILSNTKIDNNCKPCHYDNYGRLKVKPIIHKDYFKTLYNKESNIKFELFETNEFYDSYKI